MRGGRSKVDRGLALAALALLLAACADQGTSRSVALGDRTLELSEVGSRPGPDGTGVEHVLRARLGGSERARGETLVWAVSDDPRWTVVDGGLRFPAASPSETVESLDSIAIRLPSDAALDVRRLRWLELDRFGGWTAIRTRATGRFRVERIDGVWWLVTPAGHAFYCAGVTGFDPAGDFAPALGTSPYRDAILARYGSEEAWAEAAQERFRGWQLDCVGGWSDPTLFADRIPYAVNESFMSEAPEVPGWPGGITGKRIRDVFAPEFDAGAARRAAGLAGCAENPFCIGVYSDNELPWGPGVFQVGTYVDAYLTLPAGAPGKRELQAFLERRYGGDVDAFNREWGTALESFDEIQGLSELGGPILDEPAPRQQVRLAFLRHVAERYFRVVHDAIRSAWPDLLILGARFSPPFTAPGVIEASAPYTDVVSLNDYEFAPFILEAFSALGALGNRFLDGPFEDLDWVYERTDRPVLITEYFYRVRRPGVLTLPPGLPEVADEAERVAAYTRYQDEMLSRPWVVGTHWFQYQDQPVEGRFDGENQIIGLVTVDDEPHRPLVDRMTAVNGATYPRRAALAPR